MKTETTTKDLPEFEVENECKKVIHYGMEPGDYYVIKQTTCQSYFEEFDHPPVIDKEGNLRDDVFNDSPEKATVVNGAENSQEGKDFKCEGCGHILPEKFCMRTECYCYLCDPNIELSELLSDEPIVKIS